MCGIVGIYSHEPVAAELYDSLIHLQHRGQDAAGILTCDERFYPKHGLGLVREIFTPEDIMPLKGNIGIAHTRYPTAAATVRLIFNRSGLAVRAVLHSRIMVIWSIIKNWPKKSVPNNTVI